MGRILAKKAVFFYLLSVVFQSFVLVDVRAEFIAEGVELTALTRDGKSSAVSWAYQGDKILVLRTESNSQRELLIMNSDGSNKESVTDLGYPFFAEWSWDGSKISYLFADTTGSGNDAEARVFIYDLATKRSIDASDFYSIRVLRKKMGLFGLPIILRSHTKFVTQLQKQMRFG